MTRKGGNEMIVYFGEEVENALKTYLYTTRTTSLLFPVMRMPYFCPRGADVWGFSPWRIW